MARVRSWIPSIVVLPLLSLPTLAGEGADVGQIVAHATEAYRAGQWEACGTLYAEAIEHGARFETVPFNAACCFALSGDVDRAFDYLNLSLERGWRDVTNLESDTDLKALHDDERWREIVKRAAAARDAYASSINEELLRLYEEDQGDRSGQIDWSLVAPRDEERRRRVLEILEAGDLKAADDYYHAAMVLQHGRGPEDFKRAHELAVKAAEMNPDHASARWLAAAAKDRHLQSIGEPQIYGTQFRKVDGRWTLEPIDETAVTDEERARWDVPPLASAKRRMEEMNGGDRTSED